jgi:protein-S-isoprenylcysteine O-methyltransferase
MTVQFYSNFLAFAMGYLLPSAYLSAIMASVAYDYFQKVTWTKKSMLLSTATSFIIGLIFRFGYRHLDFEEYDLEAVAIIYTMSLAAYHFGEYMSTAYFHSATCSWEGFLLNHSREYTIAIALSYMELGTKFILSQFVDINPIFKIALPIGLSLIGVGHLFRMGGLISGGTNFTHQIRWKDEKDHTLVVGGFFSICRHPGYFGWFVWSVGTQVLLCNPVCIFGFAKAARGFFSDRIDAEEYSLYEKFKTSYVEYSRIVPRFPLKLDAFMLSI